MSRDDSDDGLAEVKAILGRLQRISRPGNDNAAPPLPLELQPDPLAAIRDYRRPRWLWWGILVFCVFAVLTLVAVAAIYKVNRDGDLFEAAGGGDARSADVRGRDLPPAATAAGAAVVPQPPPAPAASQPAASRPDGPRIRSAATGDLEAGKVGADPPVTLADRPLLPTSPARTGSDLLASGQVQAARAALLGAVAADSADVAFALARSYDPKYLATLPSADAAPDVAEAKRWYQAWYDIAVRQGLVSDRVPLDRIIRSMD